MYLIKQQQPCLLTQFKKPELLEDTNSITLLYILSHPSAAASSSSVLCSPQTSSTVVLTVFLASAALEEEIHYPVAWQLGGRSGMLPVGAARSQLGGLARAAVCTTDTLLLVVLNFILLL